MKKKNFLKSLWSSDGEVSTKRIISLVGFILLCIAFTINIFREVKLKEYIWDGMLWVVLGGLGLTVADKFNYKNRNNRNNRDNDNYDGGTNPYVDNNTNINTINPPISFPAAQQPNVIVTPPPAPNTLPDSNDQNNLDGQ